jgi:very-short-patch-repair endonuclease
MTDAERLLWSKLRRKQIKTFQFYRQRIIGNYIVDFYCPKGKLIIEVDGGQHYSEEGNRKDKAREDY